MFPSFMALWDHAGIATQEYAPVLTAEGMGHSQGQINGDAPVHSKTQSREGLQQQYSQGGSSYIREGSGASYDGEGRGESHYPEARNQYGQQGDRLQYPNGANSYDDSESSHAHGYGQQAGPAKNYQQQAGELSLLCVTIMLCHILQYCVPQAIPFCMRIWFWVW